MATLSTAGAGTRKGSLNAAKGTRRQAAYPDVTDIHRPKEHYIGAFKLPAHCQAHCRCELPLRKKKRGGAWRKVGISLVPAQARGRTGADVSDRQREDKAEEKHSARPDARRRAQRERYNPPASHRAAHRAIQPLIAACYGANYRNLQTTSCVHRVPLRPSSDVRRAS